MLVQPPRVLLGPPHAGGPLGERGGLVRGEPVELDLGEEIFAPQPDQEVTHRTRGVEVLGARGRRHDQPRPPAESQQVVQELAGLHVGMREVVDNHQHRSPRGDHGRRDGVEEPMPLFGFRQQRRRRQVSILVEQFGQ